MVNAKKLATQSADISSGLDNYELMTLGAVEKFLDPSLLRQRSKRTETSDDVSVFK